jgi:hypothetical protein
MKHVEKRRNNYWSVDVFRAGEVTGNEKYTGELRSFPQISPYDPRQRFRNGGAYDQALADSATAVQRLKQYLISALTGHDVTSSGR